MLGPGSQGLALNEGFQPLDWDPGVWLEAGPPPVFFLLGSGAWNLWGFPLMFPLGSWGLGGPAAIP